MSQEMFQSAHTVEGANHYTGPEVASNEACCDALCLLLAVNVFLQVRVPDYGSVFQEGADKGDVSLLFARQVGRAGDFFTESPRWIWPSSLWQ